MNVLVDTSVWSLALRRDSPPDIKETRILERCIERKDALFSTGIIIQELLQGFRGPKQHDRLIDHLGGLPLIVPELIDHIEAASLQITCRRKGIQIGTIDALLAQLAISYDLELLTTDQGFTMIARYAPLRILTDA